MWLLYKKMQMVQAGFLLDDRSFYYDITRLPWADGGRIYASRRLSICIWLIVRCILVNSESCEVHMQGVKLAHPARFEY